MGSTLTTRAISFVLMASPFFSVAVTSGENRVLRDHGGTNAVRLQSVHLDGLARDHLRDWIFRGWNRAATRSRSTGKSHLYALDVDGALSLLTILHFERDQISLH